MVQYIGSSSVSGADVQIVGNTTIGGEFLFQDKVLTNTNLLNMAGTPITVVDAPGAGFINFFQGAVFHLIHGGTDFVSAAGEDFQFRYTDGSGVKLSQVIGSGILNSAATVSIWVPPVDVADATGIEVVSGLPNGAIVLDNIGGGEIATGDGTGAVRVFFIRVEVSTLTAIA